MGSSAVELITPIVTLIRMLNPSSVLDVGAGFGKWGFLCREYLEVWNDRVKKDEWELQVDGIEIFPEYHNVIQPYIYDHIYYQDARKFKPKKQYDLVIACDVIEHMPKKDGLDLVNIMSSSWSGNCIISIPLGDEWMKNTYGRNPYDAHLATWSEADMSEEWHRIKVMVPDGRLIGIFFKGKGFTDKIVTFVFNKYDMGKGLTVSSIDALAELNTIKNSRSYKLARIIARIMRPFKTIMSDSPARISPRKLLSPKKKDKRAHIERESGVWNHADIEYLTGSVRDVEGDFAEIGVFRGKAFWKISKLANEQNKIAHAFDSFRGMDNPSPEDFGHYPKGKFDIGGTEKFISIMSEYGVSQDMYRLHAGYIPDCFQGFDDSLQFSFVILDLDHYKPTLDALAWVWHRINPSGILALDDYIPGHQKLASKAIKEFIQKCDDFEIVDFFNHQLIIRKSPRN